MSWVIIHYVEMTAYFVKASSKLCDKQLLACLALAIGCQPLKSIDCLFLASLPIQTFVLQKKALRDG